MRDDVRQLGEFLTGRCFDPAKPGCSIGTLNVYAIEEQHVKVNVEVQCTTEALDQGDGTGLGRIVGMACFLDQMRGDDAVDDAKHPAHDLGPAGHPGRHLGHDPRPCGTMFLYSLSLSCGILKSQL